MTYATESERQALISGFRGIADFLEDNPEVPAPAYADVIVFPPYATDAEQRMEIDAIASRIGSGASTTPASKHYVTSRAFGPVEYRAIAIPSADTTEL